MKKFLAPLLVLLVLLSGCKSALPANEAATLFVDQMIYHKKTEAFTKNFVNGADLSTIFQQITKDFQQNFTKGLISSHSEITTQEADEITAKLTQQIRQKTHYTVSTSQSGALTMVTYQVAGLDFAGIIRETTSQLMSRLLQDPALAKDQGQIQQALIPILLQQIAAAEVKDPQKVMLEMKQEGSKWVLVAGQEDQLNSLYRLFFTGTKTQQTLEKDMAAAVAEVTAEIQAGLQP